MTGESSTSTRRGIEVLQDHSSGLNLPPPAIDSRRDRTEQVDERVVLLFSPDFNAHD